jgi:hypothetical protein
MKRLTKSTFVEPSNDDDMQNVFANHINLDEKTILMKSRGNSIEAEPLLRHALEICEIKLGPEHPHTQTARENLASWLAQMQLHKPAR